MTQGYILSIDQGTTGTTVLILDHQGAVRGRSYAELPQHYPKAGWVEHDANEIWSLSIHLVSTALKDAGIEATDLRAIGITNQRETTVLWDRATGAPVVKAVVWQDRRSAKICDALIAEGLASRFQRKTGLVIDPYFSGTKVNWLLGKNDDLRRRAECGEIAFGTVDSWLVWNLTGGREHITDYTNASRTLLYNIYELDWDEEILRVLGIPAAMLPEVKPSSCIYGYTDPEVFFGQRIPIAGIAGDQQAALFGQACYDQGLAKCTYGTGSFVLLNTGQRPVPSREGLLTTIAWGIGNDPVEYASEGSIFTTGAAVQWLRDGLGIIKKAGETEALALSVDSNDGVYFVPALVGLGAPYWDAYARGTIVGITRGTTRGHLARATLESIGYQVRSVIEVMEGDSGISLKELRADGGAVANEFLMQFQADILGVPIEVPAIPETTALGAGYLAGLATGFWEGREEIEAKWKLARRYEPRVSQAERDRLYSGWLRAVERARGWARDEDEEKA